MSNLEKSMHVVLLLIYSSSFIHQMCDCKGKKLHPVLQRLSKHIVLTPPKPTLPLPRPPTPPQKKKSGAQRLEQCKGNVGGILQSNSCEGLVLLSDEGFLRLQRSPQLCSAPLSLAADYPECAAWITAASQESTTGSSCMLNSLHIQRKLNLLHICLL